MKQRIGLLLGLFILVTSVIHALPPGFTYTTVSSGLNVAITIRFAPDGRMFYLEQYSGKVRVMNNVSGNYVLNPTAWATIAVDNIASSERGLLGIAFDPNFTTNHYVYLYHSVPGSFNNRVIRLTEDTTTQTANTLSVVTVMEIVDTVSATNHNGGSLAFGPDGFLYVSVGDGGGSPGTRSQDTTIQLGKILRVNTGGSLPVTFSSSNIYAYGLRNSFDMAWNPVNNVLYATENGPNSPTNDEINRIVQGGNYGWPLVQGYTTDTQYVSPIYDFGTGSVAPTGITFYPLSGNFPSIYDNTIFAVDYIYGRIYNGVLSGVSLDSVTITTFDDSSYSFADIEPGPDGSLYLAAFSQIVKLSNTTSVEDWAIYKE